MAGGAGDGQRHGRGEQRRLRQFDERMALEKLYCQQMPQMLREGVKLRDFMAVKNAAMQNLLKQHAAENTVAVDACYRRKLQDGQIKSHYNLRSAIVTPYNNGKSMKQM
eukprot:gene3697-7234_t